MTNNNYGCSIGFPGALTLVFVVAKLMGLVDWPWALVFMPIWIVLLFVALLGIGIVFISIIQVLWETYHNG